MKRWVFLAVVQLGLMLIPFARAAADDFPSDAKEEAEQFRREAARILEDAEAKIAAKKAELIKRLRDLQTKYTKEGKLDEAVAIRDRVRVLEGMGKDPVRIVARPIEGMDQNYIRFPVRPLVAYQVCQKVEVEWGGQWWPAEVLQVAGNQYHIHYTGWSNSWDEWIPDCRIRVCGPRATFHRR
jgi:hypothetical protein